MKQVILSILIMLTVALAFTVIVNGLVSKTITAGTFGFLLLFCFASIIALVCSFISINKK